MVLCLSFDLRLFCFRMEWDDVGVLGAYCIGKAVGGRHLGLVRGGCV